MITSSQAIGLLMGITLLSGLFAAIYRLQSSLDIPHRQRVQFLRLGIVATWAVALSSALILSLNAGRSLGQLLPVAEPMGRIMEGSRARIPVLEEPNPVLVHAILIAYGVGLMIMGVRIISAYLKMRTLLLNSSSASALGQDVFSTSLANSPFSFGFLNPRIFLPARFLSEQPAEALRVMLIHERTHVKNHDPQWKLISLLTRAAFWFAPASWYLHRKLDLETEIECDRLTMRDSGMELQRYGNLLLDAVSALQKKQSPMFTYMTDNNLRRRIEAMKTKTRACPSLSIFFGGLMLIASATAIAATTGPSRLKNLYKVKAEVLVDGRLVSSPQFIVRPKDPASLEMKSESPPDTTLQMRLTAFDSASADVTDGIALEMDVDYETQDRHVRASPRIIVTPGEEGVVTLGSSGVQMKITAERL